MPNNYKSTQVKVIIGYVLLSLLLFISVSYIYQKVTVLIESGDYEQSLNKQRRNTYQVLNQLYQAEIVGQSVSAGQVNEFYRYQRALQNSHKTLKELQAILSDTIQKNRLDTVARLLKQKERNMYNMLKAMSEANSGQIYQQKIEHIIHQAQDTTILKHEQKIQKKIVVQEESYVVKKNARDFSNGWHRCLFRPKKIRLWSPIHKVN